MGKYGWVGVQVRIYNAEHDLVMEYGGVEAATTATVRAATTAAWAGTGLWTMGCLLSVLRWWWYGLLCTLLAFPFRF